MAKSTVRKQSIEEACREELAENVLRLRRQRGLSQAGLGKLCGMNQATISDVENRATNLTLDALSRLGEALNVPPFALIGGGRAIWTIGEELPRDVYAKLVQNLSEDVERHPYTRWVLRTLLDCGDTAVSGRRGKG